MDDDDDSEEDVEPVDDAEADLSLDLLIGIGLVDTNDSISFIFVLTSNISKLFTIVSSLTSSGPFSGATAVTGAACFRCLYGT